MKVVKFFVALIILVKSYSQIERVEPPNWWVGMKMSEIQIMIYGYVDCFKNQISLLYHLQP